MPLQPAWNARHAIDPLDQRIGGNRVHARAVPQSRLIGQDGGLTRLQRILKRSLDICLASVALVLTGPSIVVIALAIRLADGAPILFRQERIGLGGKRFTLLKFRTMTVGASLMPDPVRHEGIAEGGPSGLSLDPRVTPVGAFLRRSGLDELPQLWNVLKGDMSLVGPRPPFPSEVAMYEDWHLGRFAVRPGITGLWQIAKRDDLPFDDYIRIDLFYIENWSLLYDIYVLLKTVFVVLSRAEPY